MARIMENTNDFKTDRTKIFLEKEININLWRCPVDDAENGRSGQPAVPKFDDHVDVGTGRKAALRQRPEQARLYVGLAQFGSYHGPGGQRRGALFLMISVDFDMLTTFFCSI